MQQRLSRLYSMHRSKGIINCSFSFHIAHFWDLGQGCIVINLTAYSCLFIQRWKKYGLHRLTLMERHCPPISERKECLVPPPNGYKVPIKWPQSRNECWYRYYDFSNFMSKCIVGFKSY